MLVFGLPFAAVTLPTPTAVSQVQPANTGPLHAVTWLWLSGASPAAPGASVGCGTGQAAGKSQQSSQSSAKHGGDSATDPNTIRIRPLKLPTPAEWHWTPTAAGLQHHLPCPDSQALLAARGAELLFGKVHVLNQGLTCLAFTQGGSATLWPQSHHLPLLLSGSAKETL